MCKQPGAERFLAIKERALHSPSCCFDRSTHLTVSLNEERAPSISLRLCSQWRPTLICCGHRESVIPGMIVGCVSQHVVTFNPHHTGLKLNFKKRKKERERLLRLRNRSVLIKTHQRGLGITAYKMWLVATDILIDFFFKLFNYYHYLVLFGCDLS